MTVFGCWLRKLDVDDRDPDPGGLVGPDEPGLDRLLGGTRERLVELGDVALRSGVTPRIAGLLTPMNEVTVSP